MESSIVPRARGVQFFGACFCLTCLNSMKLVQFESTGIGLQYMPKLNMYMNRMQTKKIVVNV